MLSLGIGGLQLMMDRGQVQDWFTSTEVIAEAMIGGLGVYLFIVHMATAKEPFIPIALFKDRNFATGLALMFVAGTILVSSSSLMAPWLQNLANYPVETAGLIMAPRGIGTMMAMMSGGRLVGRLDPRKVMAVGILMLAWSTWEMTSWTPDISQWTIIATIMVQGAGIGFAFLPLQVLAFATLSPQYRTDGASLFSLLRNIGAAVGVSITSSLLVHNAQVLHESIGASVTPFNRALQGGGMISRAWNPMHAHGCGGDGPDSQPAGPNNGLYRRLLDDDLYHVAIAGAAVFVASAESVFFGARRGTCGDGLIAVGTPVGGRPAQIPASPIRALGSYLGWVTVWTLDQRPEQIWANSRCLHSLQPDRPQRDNRRQDPSRSTNNPMPCILLINPNTSARSTEMMLMIARPLLPPDVTMRGVGASDGEAMILNDSSLGLLASGRSSELA